MLKYRNTPPTPVGFDNRNSGCGPVYCGSFELLLNLSDRGRPAISVVVLPRQFWVVGFGARRTVEQQYAGDVGERQRVGPLLRVEPARPRAVQVQDAEADRADVQRQREHSQRTGTQRVSCSSSRSAATALVALTVSRTVGLTTTVSPAPSTPTAVTAAAHTCDGKTGLPSDWSAIRAQSRTLRSPLMAAGSAP